VRITSISAVVWAVFLLAAAQAQPAARQTPPAARQTPPVARQTPPDFSANVSRYRIAVVDISYIFKNHRRFKAQMEFMKKDVDATENGLRQERQGIAKLEEQLQQLKPGTPDYKQLDEQIAKEKADFSLKASKQRKEFLEREAKIYHETYLEVRDAVKYYAQRRDIGIVIRFNGDEGDSGRREDVLRAINQPIVFQNGIDITGDILEDLNRSDVARQPAGGRFPQNSVPGQTPRR